MTQSRNSLEVLALDPGEKVGWARATVNPDATWDELAHGITPLQEMALAVHSSVKVEVNYDVLIYESWKLTPLGGKRLVGSDMKSSQFVGMLRLIGWMTPRVRLVSQAPAVMSTADKTAPPWLQEILDKEPGTHDDAHNFSALRHLWFWTWVNYIKEG